MCKQHGNFSCLFLAFYFHRLSGAYIIQLFLPCSICTFLSWISFWLGHFISARLFVSVTLLLTMSTLIQGVNQNLPQVPYAKAIDLYTAACLSTCTCVIFENAFVTYLLQQRPKPDYGKHVINMYAEKFQDEQPKVFMLDKVSRILFPVIFASFTFVYILFYVVVGGNNDNESSEDFTD
jgi:hypothetical protein